MTIAQTILTQLGGNRFIAMTGAKNLVAGENSLQFSIGRGAKDGINKVRVTLETNDTYTIEFFKMRGINCDQISSTVYLHAEELRDVFTAKTGFDTSL